MTEQEIDVLQRAYRMLRMARMSSIYYEYKLWWANFWNFTFEIAIAIGSASSGVAAWALWKEGIGPVAWFLITAFATILSIIKPIINLAKIIENSTRQHHAWYSIFYEFDKLLLTVRMDRAISADSRKLFFQLFDKMASIHLDDDTIPNRNRLTKAQNIVDEEIPVSDLWMPPLDGPK